MYVFCIDNKFNIIALPKCGCTQIIKYVSQYYNYFDSHGHSFVHNNCRKYGNIHSFGSLLSRYNPNIPTYLITRPVELRVLSYYKANYYHHKNVLTNSTFQQFVDNLDKYYNYDKHHLGMISESLKKKNVKVDYLLNLSNLENNLNALFEEYDIKYTFVKSSCINKTSKETSELSERKDLSTVPHGDLIFPVDNKLFFNEKIIESIKIFYKEDLNYYINDNIQKLKLGCASS